MKSLNNIVSILISTTLILFWIAGIVLAKGFWSTFFSIVLVPYGWYLVIEKILIMYGII